jgi:L-alanine-DL-glutamate epimerase-like enolase superfamily enzyme
MATTRAPQRIDVAVERLAVSAYTVPTDEPESDATLEWDSTTIVVVEAAGGGRTGLGYTYAPAAAGRLVEEKLAEVVTGRDAFAVEGVWRDMSAALRNAGRPGIGSMAVAAVDVALWDLRARLLDVPLTETLETARDEVPVYGSGGFTSYSLRRIAEQLGGWVDEGIPRVKMKVGREPDADPARLTTARLAIGDETDLFVDANGGFTLDDALAWAERYASEWKVVWFEEPVSSADFDGLHSVRTHAPVSMEVAAGEYGYVLADFRNLIVADAVDCLQVDVTRCGGITGLLAVEKLAREHEISLSGHCAPAVSAHALCAVRDLRHLEWFHDHVRLERLLFDGTLDHVDGLVRPERERAGLGLELKRADAERFAA